MQALNQSHTPFHTLVTLAAITLIPHTPQHHVPSRQTVHTHAHTDQEHHRLGNPTMSMTLIHTRTATLQARTIISLPRLNLSPTAEQPIQEDSPQRHAKPNGICKDQT